jgi:hypothetical protein
MSTVTISKKARNAIVGTAVVAGAALGTGVGVSQCNNTPCLGDPAAEIAALPAGGTFNGTGNCYSTLGITVTQPGVTINGGTYNDPTPAGSGPSVQGGPQPIISVQAPNVTVENVTLNGLDTNGSYTNTSVGEEGIQVRTGDNGTAATGVVVQNVITNDTFGDGFILAFEPHLPKPSVTVTNLVVNHAGRQGITLAWGSGTFSNVTVNQNGTAPGGVAMASDLDGVGPDNVTFDHLTTNDGVLVQSYAGNIAFVNSTMSDNLSVTPSTGSTGNVTVQGGSLQVRNDWHGTPPAGIWVNGPANVTLTGVVISRLPGTLPATQAWVAQNGAHLVFNQSPVPPPPGSNDASSTVTVNP